MNDIIIRTSSPLVSISGATATAIADTIATSYIPKFFVSEAIEVNKNQLAKYIETEKIDISEDVKEFLTRSLLEKECLLYSMSLHSKYNNRFFEWFDNVTKWIWSFITSILGIDKRKSAQKAYNNMVETLNKLFSDYKSEHESLLQGIQKSIDKINKKKPIIKDYILKKLSIKMKEMGMDSKLSDYPMEHIDLRQFPLKDEYNIIEQEKIKLEKETETILDYIPTLSFLNYMKATKLLNKTNELTRKREFVRAKIQSDLKKLEQINAALDNIAKIFKEVDKIYIPLIERIIKDIESKWHNCYDNIPDAEIGFLYASSKILKGITEKRILKEGFGMKDAEPIVKYSNKLSRDFCELKDTLKNSMAA